MRASRVRRRILGDHESLRALLGEVSEEATRVAEGTDEGAGMLRALGLQLLSRFSDHLAFEDRFLAPALLRAGPAGRDRAARLGADHREQRELLDYILGKLRDPSRPAAVLAAEWRGLVELLLDDMAREEQTILEESLLEDPRPPRSPSRSSRGSRSIGR